MRLANLEQARALCPRMSSLPGGPADKAGATYEELWGVRGMLELLHNDAEQMCVEEVRIDGAEFWIERQGSREYWQVKRQILSQAAWTLTALAGKQVLAFFLDQRRAGNRCVFASISDAPELRILAERSRDAVLAAEPENAFDVFEKLLLEKKWREHFEELRRIWNDADKVETFELLRGIEVRSSDDCTLLQDLAYAFDVMFDAPGVTTVDCLRTFYQDSVHHRLTARRIHEHLCGRGIGPRVFAVIESTHRVLEAITATYVSGQRAKLIRGSIIPRTVTREVIAKVLGAQAGQDILITGAAGGGKSGCLLEIVEALQSKDVPVLSFRLDGMKAVQTTSAMGNELGLPESPALVLARAFPRRKIALVVDQLDCVSTTSGRHPDFFDTLSALIREVRVLRNEAELHLILACRLFDFDHDARLRGLLPANESPFQVGELTDSEVRGAISDAGGDAANLSLQQLKLLHLPQNLALYFESDLIHLARPIFISQKELFDEYWDKKRTSIDAAWGAEATQWMPVLDRLVTEMNDSQELSVPSARLDSYSPRFLNILVSEGVLTFDGRRYGFGHESFFDYCFARIFAGRRDELISFLEADDQHLFRRAQTRQILVYLRYADRPRYLRDLSALLSSSKIRPHLKLLAFELLGAFPDPGDDEWQILLPYIDSEFEHIQLGIPNPNKIATRGFEIFRGSRMLFRVADRLGYIERWLHSYKPWLEDVTITYLRWQAHEHADRIAELLEPFVDRGGEWPKRLRYMMETHDLWRSRRYFELFLRLLGKGFLDGARDRFVSNGTFWSMLYGLAKERPEWYAEIAGQWLRRQVARALEERESDKPLQISCHDQAGGHDLFDSARNAPLAFLTSVLPEIVQAAEAAICSNGREIPRDSIWWSRMAGEYISIKDAYLRACENAFEILANEDPTSLRPFIDLLWESRTYTANSLLLSAYSRGGRNFAEEAIELLCSDPARLEAGYSDSSYWISRCAISKLSSFCSAELFQTLESVLIGYIPQYERDEDRSDRVGWASFALLSALPEDRLSPATVSRISELKLKFGKPETEPKGIQSYSVVSPVPEEDAKAMDDEEWLSAIARFHGVGHYHDWEHPETGGEEQLAGMMQKFVRQEPERFAGLSMRFPADINPCYWMNILYGLKESEISSGLKIEIARRVFQLDAEACLIPAVELLSRITDQCLPQDAIDFISRLATDHPDPDRELWRAEKEGERAYFNGDILTCGINSVRGRVAEELRNLLMTDGRYLDIFLPAIHQLVRDPNISVRACAISALIGVAYHDENLAIILFQVLADTEDALLGTSHAEDFILRGLRSHLPEMRPFVERMLHSTDAQVLQVGGRLAAFAQLIHPTETSMAEAAIGGPMAARLGIAEIAERNVMRSTCRAWCEQSLSILFDDPEESVREQAARCFWHLWQSPEVPLTDYNELIGRFLDSEAFKTSPSMLLHALQDSRRQLPETVLNVCERFVDRCAEQARDIRTHHAADDYTVGPLVFRAYQQLAGTSAQLTALQLIDRMCEEGLYSAAKSLGDFER